ncbi:MAG: mobile mystery protein A [Rhodobacteraceae bacterium]|nr:mobile mystery protein A [Paracoccaceae bacterium]
MKNQNRQIARQRLDKRLSAFRPDFHFGVPSKGWVRAIRDALGMTAPQLGRRIGMKPQSVAGLEKSEAGGTIQLKTLRKAAEALDCTLVYALVPKTSLEHAVHSRAREMARREIGRIAHSMDLEAQGLTEREREEQIDMHVHEHLVERDLWE